MQYQVRPGWGISWRVRGLSVLTTLAAVAVWVVIRIERKPFYPYYRY